MKKMFIFLHANLQAKILLNKMRSLIFATRRQNSFFSFFYGPYHSKFCLNNNIGYRYIHEGVVGKLYMLST